MSEGLVTVGVNDACERLGISRRELLALVEAGELRTIGATGPISFKSLSDFVAKRRLLITGRQEFGFAKWENSVERVSNFSWKATSLTACVVLNAARLSADVAIAMAAGLRQSFPRLVIIVEAEQHQLAELLPLKRTLPGQKADGLFDDIFHFGSAPEEMSARIPQLLAFRNPYSPDVTYAA